MNGAMAAVGAGQRQLPWLLVFLVAAVLLCGSLGAKSFWIDELFTAEVTAEPTLPGLIQHAIDTERRPPLHYAIVYLWRRLAGDSETALRLPSVFFALLSLALSGALARRLKLAAPGWAAAALLAAAPTFVLYARMARAYSLNMAVGLLCLICFIRLLQERSSRAYMAYIVSAVVLLYSDYALYSLLLAQNLYVFWLALRSRRRGRPLLPPWLAGQAVLALAYLPWLWVLIMQTQRPTLEADFARGLGGYLLKLAFPAYSFSAGETIFPWDPWAVLAVLTVAALAVLGARRLQRQGQAGFVLIFLITPILFTAVLLSSVAPDITFTNMASRTLFALPLLALLLAGGLFSLPLRPWRLLAALALATAWSASLANYYANRDFLNPIYAVPMRQIVQSVNSQSEPGDIIVSDVDSGFGYYHNRSGAQTPHYDSSTEAEVAQAAISASASPRVWLVTLGRDRTRIDAPGEAFARWLSQSYTLTARTGYAPEDATYRRLKEALLKRPDYAYKALVSLYTRKAAP